ncbi:choice-of-anchor D domain-containing protein [Archangium lansingense]|uniref:Choice-of-anchor D domain-containing protein n=1 Tax=Archangium lansingense TaxID=2995310 RepID=A0ABT4AP39_9BACT|nr:choice-of-anchor D domain-containing protein [Archangium lansinium]MCY1083460.1 choice-of-anchor D domain-containing protein [Archangium lansinium]
MERWLLGLVCVVVVAGCGGALPGAGGNGNEGGESLQDAGTGKDGGGTGTGGDSLEDGGTDTSELALLELTEASGAGEDATFIGSTSTQWFFLHNRGTGAAQQLVVTLEGAAFSFTGGVFPGLGGTCGSELAAGASCVFPVSFAPTERGPASGTLSVRFGGGPLQVAHVRRLSGTGRARAQVLVAPATVDFGGVLLTVNAWNTVTLTNTGDVDALQLSARLPPAPFSFKGGHPPGAGGTCWSTLAAGESCTLVLGFLPFEAGTHKTTVSLSYEDGLSSRSIPLVLQGEGLLPASIVFAEGRSFDFGAAAVGTGVDHTFTLTNQGGVAATQMSGRNPGGPFTFKGGAYPGTGGTCGTELARGASCTVVVTFAPTSEGPSHYVVGVDFADGRGGPTMSSSVNITGTGVSALQGFRW